jgi:hypothetical protein
LSGTRPAWSAWHERLWCPLLFREAEKLLKTEPGARDQKPEKAQKPK